MEIIKIHETVKRDEEQKNAMNIYSLQNCVVSCVTKRRRLAFFFFFFKKKLIDTTSFLHH
jgi:hypothetical protein